MFIELTQAINGRPFFVRPELIRMMWPTEENGEPCTRIAGEFVPGQCDHDLVRETPAEIMRRIEKLARHRRRGLSPEFLAEFSKTINRDLPR